MSVLRTTGSDSMKVEILHRLYVLSDSVAYSQQALAIAQKINDRPGISQALLDIGRYYYFAGKSDMALENLAKSAKIAEETGGKKILINAYRYMGYIYRPYDISVAEDYYNKSLKLARETGDELSASYLFSALGNIHEMMYKGNSESYQKTLDYYLKSLEIRERIGTEEEIASSLNETSRIYDYMGLHDKSMELRVKGLQIAEKIGSIENIVFLCDILGNDYSGPHLNNFKKALEFHLKAYKYVQLLKNNIDQTYDITRGIAEDYSALGNIEQSNIFFRKAVSINDSMLAQHTREEFNLSEIRHKLEKDLEKEKSLLINSEVQKQKAEGERKTILLNASLIGLGFILVFLIFIYRGSRQNKSANRELVIKNKEIESAYAILEESENKFKLINETIDEVFYLFNITHKKYEYISPNCYTMLGLSQEWIYEHNTVKSVVYKEDLPLVVDANIRVDSGIAYDIEYRVMVNGQLKWIAEKSSPIYDEKGNQVRNSGICMDITARKNNEQLLEKQKAITEEKNKDIMDSILYAKHLQDAILPPVNLIKQYLPESFVLYTPKDIVAGDFYWMEKLNDLVLISAADCTGHGVPGALVSVVCSVALNRAVKEFHITEPGKILDKVRELVLETFEKSESTVHDGMDISLCCINVLTKEVQWSGAYNSLLYIHTGKLTEIIANKQPVGKSDMPVPFQTHTLDLQHGDSLYLFTDGYFDQFGGPNGRKFMYTQFQETLLALTSLSMEKQQENLETTFEAWKGALDQVDDVLIIGIRL
jgi:PAS domain S-box-containing protein